MYTNAGHNADVFSNTDPFDFIVAIDNGNIDSNCEPRAESVADFNFLVVA